jgi:oxidase EvaA
MNIENKFLGQVDSVTTLAGDIDKLRAESIVESFTDWSQTGDLDDFKRWFLKQQRDCSLSYTDIPLLDCKGWRYNETLGRFEHDSKEFFYLQGLRITNTIGREVVGGWDQPIITQVGFNGGILGLLRAKINGIPHYLVESKAEPGNPDKVQICPTLQATFSNIKQAHGGKRPRFVEFFEHRDGSESDTLFCQWMSEDGGRLHQKRNKGILVEVAISEFPTELPETFRWVSLFQLKELIKQNSWVSPHIRGVISHL